MLGITLARAYAIQKRVLRFEGCGLTEPYIRLIRFAWLHGAARGLPGQIYQTNPSAYKRQQTNAFLSHRHALGIFLCLSCYLDFQLPTPTCCCVVQPQEMASIYAHKAIPQD